METNKDIFEELGNLPEDVVSVAELQTGKVVVRGSFIDSVSRSQIGKTLRKIDEDYAVDEISFFQDFVEFPHQVRKGGKDILILLRGVKESSFFDGKKVPGYYSALRVNFLNGRWEVVGLDIDYSLKRQDDIIWTNSFGI